MNLLEKQILSGERRFIRIPSSLIIRYDNSPQPGYRIDPSFFWDNSMNNPDALVSWKGKHPTQFKIPNYMVFEQTKEGLFEYITRMPLVSKRDKDKGIGVYYNDHLSDDLVFSPIKTLEQFNRVYQGLTKEQIESIAELYYLFCHKGQDAKEEIEKIHQKIHRK